MTNENKGIIKQIKGQIIEVEFNGDKPAIHDILKLEADENMVLEVFASSAGNRFYCLAMTESDNLRRGEFVINTGKSLTVPASPNVLGRVFDVFGNVHDGHDRIESENYMEVFGRKDSITPDKVYVHNEILKTGIKPIDFFCPIMRGGRAGLFGGAGVGKTVLLTELINNIVIAGSKSSETEKTSDKLGPDGKVDLDKISTVSVFAAVGERSREAQELLETLDETGVLPFVSLLLGQMGENPAVRFRTAYAAATLAEYFRDALNKNVLFFMDNAYRFAQAGYELATLMNLLPSEDGYQSTLNSELGEFHERLISTKEAGVTVIEAIFVPSDDLTDYGVRSIFPFLSTSVVFSREVYQQGRFPAIDFLQSGSSALNPDVVGQKHYEVYLKAKELLEKSSKIERIASLVGEHELSIEDQITYKRTKILRNYMTQSFFVVEVQTGRPGVNIDIDDVVKDVEKIINGEFDDIEPREFLYIGRADEVKKE